MRSFLVRLRRRSADERGAVLVLVAGLMVVFIGMAALAVDLGSYRQSQTQAQSAADAAALAGAQQITSGTTAVTTASQQVAASNYPAAAPATVSMPDASHVKVVVSGPSRSFFGQFFGSSGTQVSASAVATQTGSSTPCSTPGKSCYAYFAMDSTCPGHGISISGGNSSINGGVYTNSGLSINGGINTFQGPVQYGAAAQCSSSVVGGINAFNDGQPTPSSADITNWPINYATSFPPCGSTGGPACTGPHGTPSYCTYAVIGSYTFSSTISPTNSGSVGNGVYCAVGTGGNASDPTTWTGSIALSGGNGSATVTFIAGKVTLSGGNWTLTADKDNLLAYATTGSATLSGGTDNWTGDIFAPNGTATISGGNTSETTMVEANKVTIAGGNITGDGPSDSGTGASSSGGTESLVQ